MKYFAEKLKSSTDPFEVYQSPKLSAKGELVRAIRKSLGKTQLELAQETSLSERTIRNLEKGQPVRFETIELVANALGLEAVEICLQPELMAKITDGKTKLEKIFKGIQEIAIREDPHPFKELMLPSTVIESIGPSEIPWVGGYRGAEGLKDLMSISKDTLDYIQLPEFTKVVHSGNLFVIQGYDTVKVKKTNKSINSWWQHLIEFDGPYIKYLQGSFDSKICLEGFQYD